MASYVVSTNTAMKAYVDQANTGMKSYVDKANTFLQANDATVLSLAYSNTVTTNTAMKAYVDQANTGMASYVVASNTAMKAYVDQANTGMVSFVNQSNTGMASYVVSTNTAIKAYVDQANTGMASYVVASNTAMKAYVDQANVGMASYVVSTNTAMKAYVDQANTGIKSYTDLIKANVSGYLANAVLLSNTAGYISNASSILYYTSNNNLVMTGNIVAGGVRTTSGIAPPSNPTVGDLWYNTGIDTIGRYTFDGTSYYWIDITGPTVSANQANVITGNTTITGTLKLNGATSGNVTLSVPAISGLSNIVLPTTVSSSSTNTVTNKIPIIINGVTYYLLASTSGT
jgi:hypothetical protein